MMAMSGHVNIVITRRLNPAFSRCAMQADLPVPSVFYPDLTSWPCPRWLQPVKSILELALFMVWLPRITWAVRNAGANRLFAFFGGSSWFLLVTWLMSRTTRLPLDVYLVDDLEASARQAGHTMLAGWTRWFEPRLLRRAERVFAISSGYVEHLAAKYRVKAQWLPIVIPGDERDYQPYRAGQPDVRNLTFLGAVNALYLEALRDCLDAIRRWNSEETKYHLRLSLLTYVEPAWLRRQLGDGPELEIVFRCSPEEFSNRLRSSWAIFLPYSFSPEVKLMVSTSFPTKFVDGLAAGRPILVYGPEYASVPRYFLKNGLPLCVTRREQLISGLRQIAHEDTPELIARYAALISRSHGAKAVRELMCGHASR
jgi:hypothetical protein